MGKASSPVRVTQTLSLVLSTIKCLMTARGLSPLRITVGPVYLSYSAYCSPPRLGFAVSGSDLVGRLLQSHFIMFGVLVGAAHVSPPAWWNAGPDGATYINAFHTRDRMLFQDVQTFDPAAFKRAATHFT